MFRNGSHSLMGIICVALVQAKKMISFREMISFKENNF